MSREIDWLSFTRGNLLLVQTKAQHLITSGCKLVPCSTWGNGNLYRAVSSCWLIDSEGCMQAPCLANCMLQVLHLSLSAERAVQLWAVTLGSARNLLCCWRGEGRHPALRMGGGHVAKWSPSSSFSAVAEQQKGAETRSLLVCQIHLALLSFKLEIDSS